MPNVVKELLKESRTGHEVGRRGIFNLQRTFHVEVAEDPVFNKGYRPEYVIQNYRLVGKSAIRAGSGYPEEPGFVATTFRVTKVSNEKNFLVRVGYEPDSVIASPIPTTADLWEKEFDVNLETETVYEDLDGKRYGIPFYTELKEDELVSADFPLFEAEIEPGKVVFFRRAEAFVSAWAQKKQGDDYRVSAGEKKIPIRGQPWDRPKRVGTMRLIRDFEALDDDRRAGAMAAVGLINDAPFVGAQKGELRFDGMTSRDPRVTYDSTRGVPYDPRAPIQYETIVLSFSWNSAGWQPEVDVHIWKGDKGNEAPIYLTDVNPPVRQETQFRDYWYGDFVALLQLFD